MKIFIVFLFIILAISEIAKSQELKDSILNQSLDTVIVKSKPKMTFGFSIGLNNTFLRFKNYSSLGENPDFVISQHGYGDLNINESSYFGARSKYSISSPGVSIGITSSYRLSDNYELRLIPQLIFWEKKIYFNYPIDAAFVRGNVDYYKVMPTFFGSPVLLKYKNDKILGAKPYIVLGGSFYWNISKSSRQDIVRIKNEAINTEIGLGIDKSAKFSIELKAVLGINNILGKSFSPIPEERVYYQSIKSMKSNMVNLSFIF